MRCVSATEARTAPAASAIPMVTRSFSRITDQSIVRTGCASCSCPIRAIPPVASARYQAKKPKNMLTSET